MTITDYFQAIAAHNSVLFNKWRKYIKDNSSNYVALCHSEEKSATYVTKSLYEFCAMNGHLRAFEEVFN